LKAFSWKLVGVILVMVIAMIFVLPTVVMYSKGQSEPELTDTAIENLMDSKIYDMKKDLMQKTDYSKINQTY
jgi:hypothetical protein